MVELELDFLPHLSHLEDLSKKSHSANALMGNYASLFKGSGREFSGYEIYTPQMDAKAIDWIASARSDKIVKKVTVEERNIRCNIVLDVGSNMFYGSTDKLKCEYAAEIVNSLAFAVIGTGDEVGLIMSSSKIMKNMPPCKGKAHYFNVITNLSDGDNYGGTRNIVDAFSILSKKEEGGIIFIISDFINTTKEELRFISLLAKISEVFIIMVRDRMEKFLPSDINAVSIEDIQSGKSIIVDIDMVREEYNDLMAKDEKRLEIFFLKNDISFEKFYTHHKFENRLVQFFEREKNKIR